MSTPGKNNKNSNKSCSAAANAENRPEETVIILSHIQRNRHNVQHLDGEVCFILKRGEIQRKIILFLFLAAVPVAAGLLLLWPSVHTCVISEGNRVVVHSTRRARTETVLEEAGFRLDEEDRYRVEQDGSVTVHRKKTVSIDCFGKTVEVSSFGETVEQLLNRLEIAWQQENLMDVSPETEVWDGMKLRLAKTDIRQESYTQVLHCDTIRCFDPMLPAGSEQVLTEGKNGELQCRAEVTYVNGREVFRNVLEERVTVQPVDGIIAVGTGQGLRPADRNALPVAKNGLLRLPTGEVLMYNNIITSLATAYCDKGLTATGTQARVGAIAVDPEVIPYGTRMFIMTLDGEYVYGIATAEDCGSKDHIYDTRIDLHFDTYQECRQFGARWCSVYILS